LDDGVTIRLRGGAVHLGPHVEVRRGTIFNVSGDVQVEGPALLSWGVVIHCAESVRMERWSVATEYVTITDMAHFHTGPDRWLMDNVATRPVVVGHHAWIGPKATVTMGVTIGDHAMVGANSVVTDDVERAVLVAGAPARVIRPVGATEGDASR
jgi:acetyltransferase-like isoleucine patch superfamily enzyme